MAEAEQVQPEGGGHYADLAVISVKGGSVVAVHTRTGWRSQPVANEKAARAVFDRYVNANPDAENAEPPEGGVLPSPLERASNDDLLAEVDRRGLLRDAEEVPAVDDSISNQLGWVNKVRDDEDAYRRRAKLILDRELERPEDDQRKTLKKQLSEIVEPDEGDGDDEDE